MGIAADFLAALWANRAGDAWVELRKIPGASSFVDTCEIEDVKDPTDERAFWCFSVGATLEQSPVKNDTVADLPAAWVDIDLVPPAVKKDKTLLAAITPEAMFLAVTEVREKLEALPMPPSAVVYSGGGVHAYWRLTEPANGANEIERVVGANKMLAAICGGDEPVANAGRVMRLPGSFNDKYGENPQPVRVLSEPWHDYELDDLFDFAAENAGFVDTVERAREELAFSVGVVATDNVVPLRPGAGARDARPGRVGSFDLNNVTGGVGEARERLDTTGAHEKIAAVDNWNTNALALVARYARMGVPVDVVVEYAMQNWTAPGYSVEETAAEVRSMYDRAIAKGIRPGRAVAVGDDELTYEAWREDWALVEETGRFVRLSTQTEMTAQTWRLTNSHLATAELDEDEPGGKRVGFTKKWGTDPDAIKLHGYQMAPGQPLITSDACLNLWREHFARLHVSQGSDAPEASQAVALLRQLLLFLCDDREGVVDDVLNWIGRGVHYPADRINYALFVISDLKGAGKSLLGELIGKLYGHEGARSLGGIDGLVGSFPGDVLAGASYVCVHETTDRGDSGKFGAIERLKSMITEPKLSLNRKGVAQVSVDNYCRFFFASNHQDGLPIDANERRFLVVNCRQKAALPEAFYARFVETCFSQQGLADISRYLWEGHSEELGAVAPRGDIEAIQDSLTSDWVALLNERTAERYMYPVTVPAGEMMEAVTFFAGKTLSPPLMSKELKRGGWHKENVRIEGKKRRVYHNGDGMHKNLADDYCSRVAGGAAM